ncbi:MAG: ATP-grasp domain-containing protein [Akkermansia sp.]|nr:ATP-grasp domain-containing protein [Akkermansia sp.]
MADKKKIMLLGGLRYLLPVIDAAHELGLHVITCDYLPNNIAHKYSDEYHNVSIIDKEAVLKLAQDLQIDGIMSFAVDPGVVTAAYVQEQMGLPSFGPYESVCILQDKARFREFLRKHSFNCPWSYGFDSVDAAMDAADRFSWPAIVKPTDAAGSKGVTRVDCSSDLAGALASAMQNSLSGSVIVEEFIEKQGETTGSDSFVVDGIFKFFSFDNQYFDAKSPNPYTPSAHSWPSSMPLEKQEELCSELQRLISLLGMKNGVFNIEARLGVDGKVYIMEVSPRGGGNRLSEVLKMATGVDLIKNSVRACVGLPVEEVEQLPYNGAWAVIMLHSKNKGVFERVECSSQIKDCLVAMDLLIKPSQKLNSFRGAHDAIGHVIVKMDNVEKLKNIVLNIDSHISVVTR